MTNILSTQQAANALRTTTSDARMLDLLSQVDAFIQRGTGRDWTQDTTKNPVAISAATMLLVQWYENPSQLGSLITDAPLSFGLSAALAQLEAEALKYRKYMFYGRAGAGLIIIDGALVGDDVISLVGIYGVTGSQVSNFETKISVKGQIQQTSSSNLSENIYVMIVKSPKDDISA